MGRVSRPFTQFLSHIKFNESNWCWEWTSELSHNRYGRLRVKGIHWQAHRFSYEWFKGKIPETLEIDHLCRTRNCVNPEHLEAVPHMINIIRGDDHEYNKIRCPKGHPYAGKNLYINANGKRECRICTRKRSNKWKMANKEKMRVYQREYMRRKRHFPLEVEYEH